jgi:hypothetical protein
VLGRPLRKPIQHPSYLTVKCWYDSERHQADSETKYRLYFSLIQQKTAEYGVEPRNIYNVDEKGFMIGVVGRLKRVFSRPL